MCIRHSLKQTSDWTTTGITICVNACIYVLWRKGRLYTSILVPVRAYLPSQAFHSSVVRQIGQVCTQQQSDAVDIEWHSSGARSPGNYALRWLPSVINSNILNRLSSPDGHISGRGWKESSKGRTCSTNVHQSHSVLSEVEVCLCSTAENKSVPCMWSIALRAKNAENEL